jgi:hypothetical protein
VPSPSPATSSTARSGDGQIAHQPGRKLFIDNRGIVPLVGTDRAEETTSRKEVTVMTITSTDRREHHVDMRDRLHMPRSRGATSGMLLVLLSIWGGLVSFVGPYFGYAFTPDLAWQFTWGRLWLEILPAAATFLGGLMLLGSANRITGLVGGWLAALGGAWFVIGPQVSRLWPAGAPAAELPMSPSILGSVAEWIGFFTGLGVLITFLAASALGRISVIGARDLRRRRFTDSPLAEEPTDEEPFLESHFGRRGDAPDEPSLQQ